jgi:hypothetical protein
LAAAAARLQGDNAGRRPTIAEAAPLFLKLILTSVSLSDTFIL